ncbi:aldehyde dehydrogenase family protein [Streptomyces sp. PSKA30]|uniref:aldehyde dehydrogenase family protein n=1 Tax=Streptomyces sp. PSKA30 TaxID=2874597 RepID=UPI001CD091AB|nr:aldehyde dehydrogenase family protein [Streptomyces sp. PSKA30]MBZ9638349.1 aldehyde dehydrogenase family protein [Streptomyces sp. PSKA30]
MREHTELYIDGAWREPLDGTVIELTDPATGEVSGRVALGGEADVDLAVAAANRAFPAFSRTTRQERIELLERIADEYERRAEDMAQAVTAELGCPLPLSRARHVAAGLIQFRAAARVLKTFAFTEQRGTTHIRKEPIGVAALITPWNFPALQPADKTASALAAGCTVILKPAQLAPYSAVVLAEILEAAGVPTGVFNLVTGRGSVIGNALASHPDVALVSFTGSREAALQVNAAAAESAKRVATELGGTSPQVIMPDADLDVAADTMLTWLVANTGQICSAPGRTLVPRERLEEFLSVLLPRIESIRIGDPRAEDTGMGPLISAEQWQTVQRSIQSGLDEEAHLVTGGLGKPDGLEQGHFVKPTVFTGVTNDMTIAQEEILGPVMSVITYDTVDEAAEIANDTRYGLAGYVTGSDPADAADVGSRIEAGSVIINNADFDWTAPLGGSKESGNGREWGPEGMQEYLETKVVLGR